MSIKIEDWGSQKTRASVGFGDCRGPKAVGSIFTFHCHNFHYLPELHTLILIFYLLIAYYTIYDLTSA